MTVSPPATEVRQLVCRKFAVLSGGDHDGDVHETVHIDGGKLMARTYRLGGLMAMWLVPVGVVQFYDAAGEMLLTVNLLEELAPLRLVA